MPKEKKKIWGSGDLKGTDTFDLTFRKSSVDYLYRILNTEEGQKFVISQLENITRYNLLSKATVAKELKVNTGSIDNWINGKSGLNIHIAKSILEFIHDLKMHRLSFVLRLPTVEDVFVSKGVGGVMRAFSVMQFQWAIDLAEVCDRHIANHVSCGEKLKNIEARNLYLWYSSLKIMAKLEGRQLPGTALNLLKRAEGIKPSSPGIRYVIEFEMCELDAMKVIELHSKGKPFLSEAMRLWDRMEKCRLLEPNDDMMLWNMARISSLCENKKQAETAWELLKSHHMPYMKSAVVTEKRKIERILNMDDMGFFIRHNRLGY